MTQLKRALDNAAKRKQISMRDILRLGEAARKDIGEKADATKVVRRNKEV